MKEKKLFFIDDFVWVRENVNLFSFTSNPFNFTFLRPRLWYRGSLTAEILSDPSLFVLHSRNPLNCVLTVDRPVGCSFDLFANPRISMLDMSTNRAQLPIYLSLSLICSSRSRIMTPDVFRLLTLFWLILCSLRMFFFAYDCSVFCLVIWYLFALFWLHHIEFDFSPCDLFCPPIFVNFRLRSFLITFVLFCSASADFCLFGSVYAFNVSTRRSLCWTSMFANVSLFPSSDQEALFGLYS